MPNSHAHCMDPTSTIEYVESCPNSKHSWDRAAERKGCHRISDKCFGVPKPNLEYHCLINPYMNETVEVCAPSRRMFGGFCPEYSILAGGVQENFDSDCKKFKSPCPNFFMSTDAYKYQGCYKMINRQTTQSTKETSSKVHSENTYSTSSMDTETTTGFSLNIMLILLATGVVVVLMLIFIGKFMCSRRRERNLFRRRNGYVESEKDEKRVDNVDSGTDIQYPDSSSYLLSHSINPVEKHDYYITDVQCTVDANSHPLAMDVMISNSVDNKSSTNNGDQKIKTPDV